MTTHHRGGKIKPAKDGRIRIEQSTGRLMVSDSTGVDRLLAGIDVDGEIRIKMSQLGYNVLTAADTELIFSSDYNSFKIVATDVVTFPAVDVDSDVGESIIETLEIPYTAETETPVVLAFINNEQGFFKKPPTVAVSDSTIGTVAWSAPAPLGSSEAIEPEVGGTDKPPASTGSVHNDFTNGNNAYTSNNVYATRMNILDNGSIYYQDYYNFNFGLPADTTVTRIDIKVESHTETPDPIVSEAVVEVYDPTTATWMAVGNPFNPVDATDSEIQSSETDTWVLNLTDTYVNNNTYASGFKMRIKIRESNGDNVGYDIDFYLDLITVSLGYAYNKILDNSVKIVLADGSFGTEEKALGTEVTETAMASHIYGGSTDLWSESWTPEDINDEDFGVAISYIVDTITTETEYLKVTGFGFDIPDEATILGIEVDAQSYKEIVTSSKINVGVIRITVFYSFGNIIKAWESTVMFPQDPTAGTSLLFDGYMDRKLSAVNNTLSLIANVVIANIDLGVLSYGPWEVRYYILVETAGTD